MLHYAKLGEPQNRFSWFELGSRITSPLWKATFDPCDWTHLISFFGGSQKLGSRLQIANLCLVTSGLLVGDFPWASDRKMQCHQCHPEFLLRDLPRTFLETGDGFILSPCPQVRCLLSLSLSPLNSSLWVADVRISSHPLSQCCVSCCAAPCLAASGLTHHLPEKSCISLGAKISHMFQEYLVIRLISFPMATLGSKMWSFQERTHLNFTWIEKRWKKGGRYKMTALSF